jgi:hypothetical protein
MRVYRLTIAKTFLGLELWQGGLIFIGGMLSMQFFQTIMPAGAATLIASAICGFLILKLVVMIGTKLPGKASMHLLLWMLQSDRYIQKPETKSVPLRLPSRQK